jgi:hypothetical protein
MQELKSPPLEVLSSFYGPLSIYLKTSFRGTGVPPVKHGRDAHATF